jgi:hypothetical protein
MTLITFTRKMVVVDSNKAHDVASQFPGTRAWKLTGIHLLRDIMGWLGSLAQNWREN